MKPFEMTEEFHQTFDPRKPQQPTAFDVMEARRRAGFKIEELIEFLYASSKDTDEFAASVADLHQAIDRAQAKINGKKAQHHDPLVDQVDALTDLLYLTYGSFSLLGVDPEPIMAIVHQANMAKLFPDGKPHYDPITNKVLKPEDWAEKHAPEAKIREEIARQSE